MEINLQEIIERQKKYQVDSDVSLEMVQALNLGPLLKIQPVQLYRYSTPSCRWYFSISDDGKISWYKGVTSIIHAFHATSAPLTEWQIKNFRDISEYRDYMSTAAAYGTFVHVLFSLLALGGEVDLSDQWLSESIDLYVSAERVSGKYVKKDEWILNARQDVIGFIQWWKDYEVQPLAVEIPLSCNAGRFAGALDLPAEITVKQGKEFTRQRVIIDFKTGRQPSFYENHEIQLLMYRMAWWENFNGDEIGIANYGCKDFNIPISSRVTPYRFKIYEPGPEVIAKASGYLSMHKSSDSMEPRIVNRIRHEKVDLKTDVSKMFESIDPSKVREMFK